MRCTTASLIALSIVTLATGCETEGDQVGRVVTVEFSRPTALELMIDWPSGGLQPDGGDVMYLGAYESPAGDLRIWGGSNGDSSFDVGATRSELGVYTESFALELAANDGQVLTFELASLFEVELDEHGTSVVPLRARLLGVIAPDEANRVGVPRLAMTLAELFAASGALPDYDLDRDGVDDSWVAEGTITTEPVRLD